MKKINIGIIGLGGMAPSHTQQISQIEGAEITALCDIDDEKVSEWGNLLQIETVSRYNDYEALITDPNVDAVLSVTPNNVHYDINRLCLIHKKPLMCEKPFTRTYAEAKELLDLSQEHQSPCMVGFSYRYVPSFRMAKTMIDQGKIGEIRHVFVQYLQEWGVPLFNTDMNWRWDPSVTGTGVLADLGSHMIDISRFLIGEPLQFSATMNSLISKRNDPLTGKSVDVDIDDFTAFIGILESNIPAVFQTSRNALGCGNQIEISVYGDLGSLHMGYEYGETLTWVHQNEEKTRVRETITVPESYHLKQMQDFVDLVRGTVREETPTLLDGYLNQRAMEAVERAFRMQRTVAVDEIEKIDRVEVEL